MKPSAPKPQGRLDRIENGRFATGNTGGPGRPRRHIEADYLQMMTAACSPDAWREIVERAVNDAKTGDGRAREWLAGYVVGRPEAVAPTLFTLAAEELAEADPLRRAAQIERQHEVLGQGIGFPLRP